MWSLDIFFPVQRNLVAILLPTFRWQSLGRPPCRAPCCCYPWHMCIEPWCSVIQEAIKWPLFLALDARILRGLPAAQYPQIPRSIGCIETCRPSETDTWILTPCWTLLHFVEWTISLRVVGKAQGATKWCINIFYVTLGPTWLSKCLLLKYVIHFGGTPGVQWIHRHQTPACIENIRCLLLALQLLSNVLETCRMALKTWSTDSLSRARKLWQSVIPASLVPLGCPQLWSLTQVWVCSREKGREQINLYFILRKFGTALLLIFKFNLLSWNFYSAISVLGIVSFHKVHSYYGCVVFLIQRFRNFFSWGPCGDTRESA